ncbi:flagellar protein FliO/FliZ [Inhella inkyongensis]|uniref:Flagellar protein FliO/FliZ n=1 Tax=Inhella inkyongensis TaxID=392593 RepID=A0A840SAS5_9BURK|nr:flagellar biosynthetic protein FliO [Inhella inkyongensis]MBB5205894.1 flagellar protein FliO/FliZ [Inhella inkyongensis]
MSPSLAPALWFLAILALIPLALWLLKRTPVAGLQSGVRVIGSTFIGPGQKLLTVETGQGEERRCLLIGVSGQQIQLLTELDPAHCPSPTPLAAPSFSALLAKAKKTP